MGTVRALRYPDSLFWELCDGCGELYPADGPIEADGNNLCGRCGEIAESEHESLGPPPLHSWPNGRL